MRHLAARIRTELPGIENALNRAREGMKRGRRTGDDYYLDGVALNLHGFYSGIERVLEVIAANVDDQLPQGENWHQQLLEQMVDEIPGIRPGVLSDAVGSELDEYRGFRHVVRSVYAYQLDAERLERLTEKAAPLVGRLKVELLAFAEFLEASG